MSSINDIIVQNGKSPAQANNLPAATNGHINSSTKSSLRRKISYGNMIESEQTETKVLVIYTGGTIGMMRNEKNGKRINIIICRTLYSYIENHAFRNFWNIM